MACSWAEMGALAVVAAWSAAQREVLLMTDLNTINQLNLVYKIKAHL